MVDEYTYFMFLMKCLFYYCRSEPEEGQPKSLPTTSSAAPALVAVGERRLHECLASMASVHCICLCPLVVLRYLGLLIPNPKHRVASSNLWTGLINFVWTKTHELVTFNRWDFRN